MKTESYRNLYLNNKSFIHKDIINFNKIKPNDIFVEVEYYLKEKQKLIEQVANLTEFDYKDLLLKLYSYDEPLENLVNLSKTLTDMKKDKAMEDVHVKIFKSTRNQSKLFYKDPACVNFFKSAYKKRYNLGLTEEEIALVVFYYQKIKLSAQKLSNKRLKEVTKIELAIEELGKKFEANIAKSFSTKSMIVTDESILGGIHKSHLVDAKKNARKKGMPNAWIFQGESGILNLAEHSTCQKTREEAYFILENISNNDRHSNVKNIKKMLSLSTQKAKMYGFKTYSDYILKYNNNMAKSSREVNAFLRDVKDEHLPKALNELNAIKEFAKKKDNLEIFKASDTTHYKGIYKKEVLHVDENKLDKYFKLNNLMNALTTLLKDSFGLTLKEINIRHQQFQVMKTYKVFKNEKLLGVIYFDAYDTENKGQKGFYQCELFFNSEALIPHIYISGDVDGTDRMPFDQLTYVVHEFGHALSVLLAKNRFCYTGTVAESKIAMDFLEFPSQLLELFVYEPKFLQSISYNKKTNKQLSLPFIKQILKAQKAFESMNMMNNVMLSKLDMKMYMKDQPNLNLEDLETKIYKEMSLYDHGSEVIIHSPQFAHSFDGCYGSQYYSYVWSLYLAKEIFSVLKTHNFSKKVCNILMEELYYHGSIRSEQKNLDNFHKRVKKEL